jgi:hypothetical protein
VGVRLILDLGTDEEQDELDLHLAEKGLSVDDVLAAAAWVVPRRKGSRLYAYGRGLGGRPVVVVLARRGSAWKPRTAWEMDRVEENWWRKHGGR